MRERRKDEGVERVNAIARDVVERHDRATYVDAYALFSDDGGEGGYTTSVRGPDGKDVRVRAADGIHFTAEGGDLLGDLVFARLEPRCDLDAQAVPDEPKTVLRTPGSDGPSGGGSGSSGSPGTSATTATTGAPPPDPVPEPTPTTPDAPPPPDSSDDPPSTPPDPPSDSGESQTGS